MVSRLPVPILVSAAQYSDARLALLLSQVYVDYFLPVWMEADKFRQMCETEDVDLAESVLALIMEEPVGLALLSRRGTRGWISGVGVLPLYRRHGIARDMVRAIQQRAPALHLETLSLEVLTQNVPGLALYRKLGFREHRKLLVLLLEESIFTPRPLPEDVTWVAPESLIAKHDLFHRVTPSWQREKVSLVERLDTLRGLGLYEGGQLSGYLLYEEQPRHQAIYDLGIVADHPRRIGAAKRLLLAVHRLRPGVGGYFVNLPAPSGLLDAFLQVGYRIWQQQYEMVWEVEELA